MSDYIGSVIKGFKILELFNSSCYELGISEIRDMVGFPLSTTHRIVSTLERCGYLQQDPKTNKYCLGLKLYILGSQIEYIKGLKLVSSDCIKDLSERFNEVVHLGVLEKNKVLCVVKNESVRTLSATPKEGELSEAYSSSAGKCLLAYKSEKFLTEYFLKTSLSQITENTITTEDALRKEFEKIKKQGYAVNNEESELGLMCFCAPVFNVRKECIAGLSISVPRARVKDPKIYCDAVKEVAISISNKMV